MLGPIVSIAVIMKQQRQVEADNACTGRMSDSIQWKVNLEYKSGQEIMRPPRMVDMVILQKILQYDSIE